MVNKEIPVITSSGEEGVIESLTISELDFIVVKVRYEDKWVNYTVGKINEFFNVKDVKIKGQKSLKYEKENIDKGE